MCVSLVTQSIIRPGLEPVNGTAVDERWELAYATSECVPNRRESENDMKILSTAVDKIVEERKRCVLSFFVFSLCQRPHGLCV